MRIRLESLSTVLLPAWVTACAEVGRLITQLHIRLLGYSTANILGDVYKVTAYYAGWAPDRVAYAPLLLNFALSHSLPTFRTD
jgi:hypothetical protein